MASTFSTDKPKTDNKDVVTEIVTQLVISIALGLSAFLGFCVSIAFPGSFFNKLIVHQFLRPRWKSLYAARKRTKDAASRLPDLPDTFFGWIPIVYRITEDEILASAGLDAYVVSSSNLHSAGF